MNIVELKLSELKPYKKNARKHTDEDVASIIASINEFGFNDPLGIWGEENIIVEGHGRYLAAKKLGMKTVPCIRLDHLTDEQRRAYALAHNKTAENSEWDIDLLGFELDDIENIDMTAFGFELDFGDEEPQEAIEDDYDEEPPAEPISKLGDLYKLGNHRLMCGDSTDPAVLDRLIEGGKG